MLKKLFYSFLLFKKHKNSFLEYHAHKETVQEYVQYLKLETHLPVTHKIKQNTIQKYAKENHYQVFVETGTYLGDMVEAQKNHFKKLISIELGEELFLNAVNRFEEYSHVQILKGDSGIVLKKLLKEISEPALFWLDGHYSSGITAKSDKNTPIIEELKTILSSPFNHGILIDDARLFTGQNDYPSIPELCVLIQ